jgi:hypothetical protein
MRCQVTEPDQTSSVTPLRLAPLVAAIIPHSPRPGFLLARKLDNDLALPIDGQRQHRRPAPSTGGRGDSTGRRHGERPCSTRINATVAAWNAKHRSTGGTAASVNTRPPNPKKPRPPQAGLYGRLHAPQTSRGPAIGSGRDLLVRPNDADAWPLPGKAAVVADISERLLMTQVGRRVYVRSSQVKSQSRHPTRPRLGALIRSLRRYRAGALASSTGNSTNTSQFGPATGS